MSRLLGRFFMKSKFDNDYKALILEQGIDKRVSEIKRDLYKKHKTIRFDDYGIGHEASPLWEEWYNLYKNNPKYDCAFRLIESKYRKAKRIKDKINDLVRNNNAVFITLTFTDNVLASTSQETRRRYVARYLKEQSPVYVANIDFSPDKNREHYHAVIMTRADFTKWQYGFVYAEEIRNHDKDIQRTSKYVAKLTSHALKTNAITRLIYSRDTI